MNQPRDANGRLLTVPVEDRLWNRIHKAADGCWLWTGATNTMGYGQIYVDGKNRLVTRTIWALKFGSIPNGLLVLHRCDTPPCCNPDHLFIGNQSDNMRDCASKGRIYRGGGPRGPRVTHCLRGHEYSQDNTRLYRGERYCRACGHLRRRGVKTIYSQEQVERRREYNRQYRKAKKASEIEGKEAGR